jgi:hypothetical protein
MSVTNGKSVSPRTLERVADQAHAGTLALVSLDTQRSWARMEEADRREAIDKLRSAARFFNDQVIQALAAAAGEDVTATCATCGGPFVPRRADARYCSAACRQRAYRQRSLASR